jgi:ribonuclease G
VAGDEILINVAPGETRVAVLEQGVLQDVIVERAARRGLVGNIYRGRVARVLPGMQAAFVDIGLARTAFLHADDIPSPPGTAAGATPPVRDLLREGDPVLVQVRRDPLGTKGARVSMRLTVPSRYLVLLPGEPGAGVSALITAESERDRLRAAVTDLVAGSGDGCIVRTAADGVAGPELAADYAFVRELWALIRASGATAPLPGLVHAELPVEARVLRELRQPAAARVWVDAPDVADALRAFAARFVPELAGRIEVHADPRPLLDRHGVEDELTRLLGPRVALRSGGHLVIERTEAMTTVDVNTGAFVGHRDQEETILRTNLEAAQAVARQLRLRNLGGIVVIDFIDLATAPHRRQVLETLQAAVAGDPGRPQVVDVDALGLVVLTRKRTRDSLDEVLARPCGTCGGTGRVKAVATVGGEVLRAVRRRLPAAGARECVVIAHREVIDWLQAEPGALAGLAAAGAPPLRLQSEPQYAPEQFDVVVV